MAFGPPPIDDRTADSSGRVDRDRPRPGFRREGYLAVWMVVATLCITLLQYSQCTYQPMSSPPWSVDPWLIAATPADSGDAVACEGRFVNV